MEIIINRDELYDLIFKYCKDKYSIGFHGINYWNFTDQTKSISEQVENIKQNVLNNGLYIKSGRTLLGTVAFSDVDEEKEFINYHQYGTVKEYVLIALPKFLKNQNGDSIYLGNPTYYNLYKNRMYTQGYQITSLSDSLLPDYTDSTSILNPMFVLGVFSITENDQVKLFLNNKHIAFNNDIVPNSFFDDRKQKILNSCDDYKILSMLSDNSLDQLKKVFFFLNEIIELQDYVDVHYDIYLKFSQGNFESVPQHLKEVVKNIYTDSNNNDTRKCVFGDFPVIYNETIRQYVKQYYDLDLAFELKKDFKNKTV